MVSDLESVNTAHGEDSLRDCKLEEPNLNVEFEPFFIPHTEDTIFAYDLTTSSFLKNIIETYSN